MARREQVFPGPEVQNVYVRMGTDVLLYKEKAPYVKSGVGPRGALPLDVDSDQVQCHECGKWFEHLGSHVFSAHGMTGKQYKAVHGLNSKTALVGEKRRERSIAVGVDTFRRKIGAFKYPLSKQAEFGRRALQNCRVKGKRPKTTHLNKVGHCQEQLSSQINALAKELGRTPTIKELNQRGLTLEILSYHFGSLQNAMRHSGLIPREKSAIVESDEMIRRIREFKQSHGRLPYDSDTARGIFYPSRDSYRRRFGSWQKAVSLAG